MELQSGDMVMVSNDEHNVVYVINSIETVDGLHIFHLKMCQVVNDTNLPAKFDLKFFKKVVCDPAIDGVHLKYESI